MHAVVVRVSIRDAEAAQKGLEEIVVPRISQSPGLLVFESEDAARAVAERIPGSVPDGVTFESAEVREVAANA